jgi:glycerol-3-phosphate acyltransferase PlsY
VILLFIVGAFIIGSIPSGAIVASLRGVNLRTVGSGNIGATNVLRAMGKGAALATFLGDLLKGAAPIWLARAIVPDMGLQLSETAMASMGFMITDPRTAFETALGLAAILGHNYSIFLRFRGGKGVATSLGVLLALSPHVALLTATIWLFSLSFWGYSSLSALVAFGALPMSFLMIDPSPEKIVFGVIAALLVFIRHTANIRRLIQGTETRVLRKKR